MGKDSWETVLAKCKELDLKPESVLKIAQRMSGKNRTETPKEVLRASWVYDVAWHVYHRTGTTDQKKKITQTKLVRNYVETQHYQDNYKVFFQKEWDQLPSILKSNFHNLGPVAQKRMLVQTHTSNCVKLLLSEQGKENLSWLIISGGSYIEVPGTKTEYLKNLKKAMSDPMKQFGKNFGPMTDEEVEEFKKEYPWEYVKGQWVKKD